MSARHDRPAMTDVLRRRIPGVPKPGYIEPIMRAARPSALPARVARERGRVMGSAGVVRHVMLHGRVQGVGFRAFVAEAAYRHGADGWVRNRRDGSVEAVFAATPAIVNLVIEACRAGPDGARVDALHQSDADFSVLDERRGGESFSVLPTM